MDIVYVGYIGQRLYYFRIDDCSVNYSWQQNRIATFPSQVLRKVSRIWAILASLILVLPAMAQSIHPSSPTVTYRNPVIAGDFADPSVIRVGNTYYAVGTSSEWGPVFPIYSSTDLINWTYVGPVFPNPPSWTMGSFWAPELYHRDGMFYVYYTARRKTDKHSFIGVATTRDLRQGFSDHGLLLEWTSEAIDPFIIEDNQKRYITWKAYGLDKGKSIEILGAELAPDGLKVTGQAFALLKAESTGWESGGAEGQALFKRGRYYYMLYSGNTCCGPQCHYQVGLARAEKLQGPWEKFAGNPVLIGDDVWKCPGHGTVVTTPDNRYFYLHHAYNGTDFTFAGRQGVLSELLWDEKTQWPVFRYGTSPPAQAESPLGNRQEPIPDLSTDFSVKAGNLPWVWDVTLPAPVFTVQDGTLQFLHTTTSPAGTFLGLVIKKGTYTFTVDISPQANLLQSICLYGDASNALGLGIGKDSLELWQVKNGTRQVLKRQPQNPDVPVTTLQVRSYAGRFYEFGSLTKANSFQPITEAPIDGLFLPRWDRAPRVGISVSGQQQRGSLVRSVSIKYE